MEITILTATGMLKREFGVIVGQNMSETYPKPSLQHKNAAQSVREVQLNLSNLNEHPEVLERCAICGMPFSMSRLPAECSNGLYLCGKFASNSSLTSTVLP